jgi:hypothetical protein
MVRTAEKPKCITAEMFQLVGGFGRHEIDRTLRIVATTVTHDAGSYQLVELGPQTLGVGERRLGNINSESQALPRVG